ncbi:MAG: phosphate ABC transporter ATP-binding protein [Spirochaetales bacterium]|nr:phosphate ABC transporter ATP-binding protein [Spirochaetales bacterium]
MEDTILKTMQDVILKTEDLSVWYGETRAVKDVNVSFAKHKISSIMGPSGCGKTTLLRCLNRIHELNQAVKITGRITLNDENLLDIDPILVRRKVGMVFQRPNPFPTMNIYDNVMAGYKLNGFRLKRSRADEIVERSLAGAGLWKEVRDSLFKRGTFLSGGQQQRLCIARTLALEPEVLLLDEPTSALDPHAMTKIEELLVELKKTVTIIIVTHNLGQAGRISDYTSFMYLGELLETGPTESVFTNPKHEETEKYLTGRIG